MPGDIDVGSLEALFAPRAIAVVGASSDPSKIGGRPVDYLKTLQFDGGLYPVNPNAGAIQNLPAYASIGDLPDGVDLAIIAVPATRVHDAIIAAAAKGIGGLVIFSAGFAEIGGAGIAAQDRLVATARAAGIRLLGPNCIGFVNISRSVYATFSPVVGMGQAKAGSVAIVSQSGAFGAFAYTLARERGLGLSKWIATGNECDVDVADCIAWLAGDPGTSTILVYLEGAKDGRKLMTALEMARAAGKPVIVTKVGRSAIGAAAAASHTAALAGQDAVYDAVLRQCGALRTQTIEAFFDVGYAVSRAGLPAGRSIGLITVSGGVGVLMADDSVDSGLDLAEMSADAQAKVKAMVPFAATRNPLDITGQVTNDHTLLDKAIAVMLGTGQYQMLAGFMAAQGLSDIGRERLLSMVQAIRDAHPEVLVAMCSVFRAQARIDLEALGALAFEDPTRMIRALSALAWLADAARRPPMSATLPAMAGSGPVIASGVTNERDALQLLSAAGLPVVPTALAGSADQAVAAAQRIGYPVVAKIVSADILHKTDVGGVSLNLRDDQAVRDAYAAVMANVERRAPTATIDGVLIAPMITGGIECILGVQQDPAFGPVVMFGLGGVLVDALKDVSFRAAPFGRDEALSMIREIRAYPVLTGLRGAPPADIDALADALVALSTFAASAGASLQSLDINPMLVRAQGEGVMALDAVIVGPGVTS